jgi:hypothetical protein
MKLFKRLQAQVKVCAFNLFDVYSPFLLNITMEQAEQRRRRFFVVVGLASTSNPPPPPPPFLLS